MSLNGNSNKSNPLLKDLKEDAEKVKNIETLRPPESNKKGNSKNEERKENSKTSSNKKSQQKTSKDVNRKKSSTSKNKGGRPLKDKSKKATKKVTTYLTEADYLLLQETAESFDETIANYVRSIIKEHIRESK